MLSRLARCRRMIFLYVSDMNMIGTEAAKAMKRVHHCVQRQPLNWAAKPPITGPRAGPRNYECQRVYRSGIHLQWLDRASSILTGIMTKSEDAIARFLA